MKINKMHGRKILMFGFMLISVDASSQYSSSATNPYPNMPIISPIGADRKMSDNPG